MVSNDAELQQRTGLYRGTVVQCRVTAHRGRFGVDVQVVSHPERPAAFIDFVLLAERGQRVAPENFPPVGSAIEAIVVAFMPNGELRLDARPSMVDEWQAKRDKPDPAS